MSTTRTAGLPKREPRRTHRQVAEDIFWTMSIEQLREYIEKYGIRCQPEEPLPGCRTDISWGTRIGFLLEEPWTAKHAERTGILYKDLCRATSRHIRVWGGSHIGREKEMLIHLATELSVCAGLKHP